ncbi:MAG: galactokinase [Halobacteriaceae archaeon]
MSGRLSTVEDAFAAEFGPDEPSVAHSAPGRVNLIGGHTDYNDGFVLPAAIDRRTVVAGRPRDDASLHVHSATFEETAVGSVTDPDPLDQTWANYVLGVAAELGDLGHDVPGANLAIASDVPMGAGLASSAALELAAAATLADLADADLDPGTLADVSRRAENEFVGVSCGLMDQFAAAFGRADRALFLDCRTRAYDHIPLDAEQARLVVTDTCVEHELVDSEYNRRVRQCEQGVEHLGRLLDRPVQSLRDVSPADLDAHRDRLPGPVANRVEHVVTENERVQQARDALSEGDVAAVGDLMAASHESLRDLYEVSCDELDAVVEIAADQPAVLGSRMTGAGFGGCVVSLVEPAGVDEVVAAVESEYEARTGIDPDVHVFEAADGLERER